MERRIVVTLLAGVLALTWAATAAAAPYVPHQLIVKYASGASSTSRGLAGTLAGVTRTLGRIRGLNASVVRVAGDPRSAAARLNRSSAVLYAEPDYIMHETSIPNDPLFGQLYGLNNANDADIDAPEGWTTAFGAGRFPSTGGTKVGIVDTGIDANHEDLAGKTVACAGVKSFGIILGLFANYSIVSGRCVDDNDHGTHVAGTLAATANNGKGVAGVAPNARLVICKALDASGSGPTSAIANCINWVASQGVKVISMSLGGGASTTMQTAIDNAWKDGKGAVVVAAAGNDGDGTVEYPAGYPDVVSVAATDSNDQHASFSNVNGDVELSAPGVDVLSTKRGGGYVAFSGTSMATPHVAGVAAMIAYRFPSLSAAGIRSRLDARSDDLGPAGRDPTFGFGRVNLARALAR